jgi:hypothetical protein
MARRAQRRGVTQHRVEQLLQFWVDFSKNSGSRDRSQFEYNLTSNLLAPGCPFATFSAAVALRDRLQEAAASSYCDGPRLGESHG